MEVALKAEHRLAWKMKPLPDECDTVTGFRTGLSDRLMVSRWKN